MHLYEIHFLWLIYSNNIVYDSINYIIATVYKIVLKLSSTFNKLAMDAFSFQLDSIYIQQYFLVKKLYDIYIYILFLLFYNNLFQDEISLEMNSDHSWKNSNFIFLVFILENVYTNFEEKSCIF